MQASVSPRCRSEQGLADAEAGHQPAGDRRTELAVDGEVVVAENIAQFGQQIGLGHAEPAPPLAMADQHAGTAAVGQHRHRDLAGVGAAGFPVAVLRADLRPGHARLGNRRQHRERGVDHHLHVARDRGHRLGQLGHVSLGLADRLVHFPIGRRHGHPLTHSFSPRFVSQGQRSGTRCSLPLDLATVRSTRSPSKKLQRGVHHRVGRVGLPQAVPSEVARGPRRSLRRNVPQPVLESPSTRTSRPRASP